MLIRLKRHLNVNVTWKLYDIILQYKEMFFFETYTTYSLYFKDIWYNCSTQRKVCLKHIPDITFTLNIYDIFAMYITYTLKIYDIVIQYKEILFWKIYHI